MRTQERAGLRYVADKTGTPVRFKPWLSDAISFLYDPIMEKSVIPRKLGADIQLHYRTLSEQLAGVHNKPVLELGTGSGSTARFLPGDNSYTGTDISVGLLKRASKKLARTGFAELELYECSTPVPERNKRDSIIRGTLHSQSELKQSLEDRGFIFEPHPTENGAVLYFRARKSRYAEV
jgi:protein-L-isoaspartate O-methyltransferase